jgi:hypothetical protein
MFGVNGRQCRCIVSQRALHASPCSVERGHASRSACSAAVLWPRAHAFQATGAHCAGSQGNHGRLFTVSGAGRGGAGLGPRLRLVKRGPGGQQRLRGLVVRGLRAGVLRPRVRASPGLRRGAHRQHLRTARGRPARACRPAGAVLAPAVVSAACGPGSSRPAAPAGSKQTQLGLLATEVTLVVLSLRASGLACRR